MKNIIRRAILTELEDKKTKLLRMVYSDGIFFTAKLVGGYDKLIEMTDDDIPYDMKISEIQDILRDEIDSIDISNAPITLKYDFENNEIHQIEWIAHYGVIIQMSTPKVFTNRGEYKLDFYQLPDDILNEVCQIVYDEYTA